MAEKFYFRIVLLLVSVFLFWQSIFASDQADRISNADEEWTTFAIQIEQSAIDTSGALLKLPKEVVVCHADEVWNYDFEIINQDIFYSFDNSFTLPIEAAICHFDEVWNNDLASFDVGSGPVVFAKNPVLFVPGIITTEIKDKNDNLLWIEPLRLFSSLSDDFLDDLMLDVNLSTPKKELKLGEVITKKIIPLSKDYDYTEGLINQFIGLGYIEGNDFFTFPYDWRYGVSGKYPDGKTNSVLLKEKIDDLVKNSPTGKVDVIAHSLGGLVTKQYIINNDNPKIDKLIFVGVPNLGSPRSVLALLDGTDLGITGLNPQEFKKISQNLPVSYDLMPTKGYYAQKGSYVMVGIPHALEPGDAKSLNYEESLSYFKNVGLNPDGITNADNHHLHTSQFDYFDARTKGVDIYNIVGCKSGTFHGIIDNLKTDDKGNILYATDEKSVSGDDTVPFESADSIPADSDKTFFFQKAKHGEMPSADGIRQKIASIVAGVDYPKYQNMITHDQLVANNELCELDGDYIIVKSPVDVSVTDENGKIVLGIDSDGDTHYDIPGASFEIMGGHKYVYLPSDMGSQYKINLQGSGTGTFTLVEQKIEGDRVQSAQVFNDVPVSPAFSGSLKIDGAAAQIVPSVGPVLNPNSLVAGEAASDILAPRTTVLINGTSTNDFYNANAVISLTAQDFAQEGVTPAGLFSISYALDGAATTTYQTAITVSQEGRHTFSSFAGDKLGNKEIARTISFAIDKTPPEVQFVFDQSKKDLVFSATDNYSASGMIAITDQNGVVTAADQAGNISKLTFNENRIQSLRAQLTGLAYNGKAIDMAGSQLAFAWFYGYAPTIPAFSNVIPLPVVPPTLPKTGPLSFLLQQAKLKDGSFIVAIYSNGKTLILEYKNKKLISKTVAGLKLVGFATNGGKLEWNW